MHMYRMARTINTSLGHTLYTYQLLPPFKAYLYSREHSSTWTCSSVTNSGRVVPRYGCVLQHQEVAQLQVVQKSKCYVLMFVQYVHIGCVCVGQMGLYLYVCIHNVP